MVVAEQKPPSRSDAGPGADNRSQRTSEILEAALDLYAEHGFARVTTKSIGRACGMNAALIYYYFENKEDLFRAVIERAITQMLERYRNMQSAHDDPVRLIDDWFEVNVALKDPGTKLSKIMSDYSFAGSRLPSADRLIDQLYEREVAILEENIAECVRLGIFSDVNPKDLAQFVSVHLDGIFFASMIRSGTDLAEMVNDLKRLLWNNLASSRPAA